MQCIANPAVVWGNTLKRVGVPACSWLALFFGFGLLLHSKVVYCTFYIAKQPCAIGTTELYCRAYNAMDPAALHSTVLSTTVSSGTVSPVRL